MAEIKIIDIPEKMQKYYGSGTMLHPDIQRVEEAIRNIPKGRIVTIDIIADKMAKEVGADMSCPLRTGNALKKIAELYLGQEVNNEVPFWRVIRKDHKIVKSKNYELAAGKLEDEGFDLQFVKGEDIKVNIDESDIHRF